MDSDFVSKFWQLTDSANSIVVTSHITFDDDSIASVLSAYRLLVKKYPTKKVRIVYAGLASERYSLFADFDKIEFTEDIADKLDDCDLLIMLDGNQYSRFSRKMTSFTKNSICIDHHASVPGQFTLSLIEPSAMATSELIYEKFYKNIDLDAKTAEILLMGLLGDTGNFTYIRPENGNVLEMAKVLIEKTGREVQEFKASYSTITSRVFLYVQELVKNTVLTEISGWPKFMYSFVSREFSDKNKFADYERSDASHIYVDNYLRIIKDYSWGFTVLPKMDGTASISCRSLPKSVNVRDLMERAVKGGGHDRAAGGSIYPEGHEPVVVEGALETILEWMKNNPPVIS